MKKNRKYTYSKEGKLLNEAGLEDTQTLRGSLVNRPVTSFGMILFLIGTPIMYLVTEHNFASGTIFTLGAIIASYGMSKHI